MDTLRTTRNPLDYYMDEAARLEKSPQVEGIMQGAKAAIMAAPVGAAVQALRSKNPYMGAIIAGLGAGALAGLSAAAIQKYKNLQVEAGMRYHLRNMIDREPTVGLPNSFATGFEDVRNSF